MKDTLTSQDAIIKKYNVLRTIYTYLERFFLPVQFVGPIIIALVMVNAAWYLNVITTIAVFLLFRILFVKSNTKRRVYAYLFVKMSQEKEEHLRSIFK